MALQPSYVVLDKLLYKRLFEIPDYQRTYNWGKKQRTDLFSDIKKLSSYRAEPERHHFMATVVCLNANRKEEVGADEYDTLLIVDGQQRLTTLIILLKEICRALGGKQ